MNKPETTMRQYLVKGLRKAGCDAMAVENGDTCMGTPDINACYHGNELWIECKCLPAFPKRPTTTIKIGHYSIEQYLWLRERVRAGGNCLLILKTVEPTGYYVLGPESFKPMQKGLMTERDIINESFCYFKRSVNFAELLSTSLMMLENTE